MENLILLTSDGELPLIYVAIGCVLMAILGGFTAEITILASMRQLFSVLLRSFFIGITAFLVGISIKAPWWLKIAVAGIFGFIGIPSLLSISKQIMSGFSSLFNFLEEVMKEASKKSGNGKDEK